MKIGLVAGETSGDLLGAGLIHALRGLHPDVTFEGVAGPNMHAAGCDSWHDAESLAVMGLIEPLAEIPRLVRLRRSLIRRWRAAPPDVFVGIDAPDFNLGLELRLRQSGIRTAHYVSPSVWAWRKGRIRTVARAADLVLCILPFEPALYDNVGVHAVFVGHPKADMLPLPVDTANARRTLGVDGDPLIAVLPGSRVSEVSRLGPIFALAAAQIASRASAARFVTPIATGRLRPLIEAQLRSANIADRFTLLDGGSLKAMEAADVVMLASGTAALESALLTRPTVAAYQFAPFSALLFRLLGVGRMPYYTLPNLLTKDPLVPEFMQENARPERIAEAVLDLLERPDKRAAISAQFARLHQELALGADERAARAVLALATRSTANHVQ